MVLSKCYQTWITISHRLQVVFNFKRQKRKSALSSHAHVQKSDDMRTQAYFWQREMTAGNISVSVGYNVMGVPRIKDYAPLKMCVLWVLSTLMYCDLLKLETTHCLIIPLVTQPECKILVTKVSKRFLQLFVFEFNHELSSWQCLHI